MKLRTTEGAIPRIPSSVRGYLRQSRFSSPGIHAQLFDPIPDDAGGLCKVVQGLLVHYRDPSLTSAGIPRSRLREVNLRYVDRMLARLRKLDPGPLTQARPIKRRLIGCCRDFATLFTSMARHKGVPCRIRVGFANYFAASPSDYWIDHTIAERWKGGPSPKWKLVDPEQSEALAKENRLAFDPSEVPWGRFIVGGEAWRMCREERADPERFCVDPGGEPHGLWFVRSRLLLDLAALNREELLLWDSWEGTSPDSKLTPPRLAALDQLARFTARRPPAPATVARIYERREWRPPRRVFCFSPVCRPYRELLRE